MMACSSIPCSQRPVQMEVIDLVPLYREDNLLSFAFGKGGLKPSALMLAEIHVLFSEVCKASVPVFVLFIHFLCRWG